jgi:hypothetical protein
MRMSVSQSPVNDTARDSLRRHREHSGLLKRWAMILGLAGGAR